MSVAAIYRIARACGGLRHLPPHKLLYAPHGRLLHYTVCSVHIRSHPYKIAVYPPTATADANALQSTDVYGEYGRSAEYGCVRISTERYGAALDCQPHYKIKGLKARQKNLP